MVSTANVPLLEVRGLSKSFPGVKALQNVDLTLKSGEVLGLLGENGAGKSTLIKILAGVFPADAGHVRIDGNLVAIPSPVASRKLGIGVIHQELNLVPAQTVRENLFLGDEGGLFSILRTRQEFRQVRELSERLGMPLDASARIRELTVAQQQTVEIAKALACRSRILIMDEPTSALSPREVEGLFRMIRDLTAQGIGIVYVSHRLDEVFEICQRVTVFRDGEHVGTRPIQQVTRESLIEMMVGRKLEEEYPKRSVELGQPRLSVRNLSRGTAVRDVSLTVRRGEIVALTGLMGAGRTETARLIFAADRPERGTVELDGRLLHVRNPRQAIAAGICLLTEDRKHQGLILKHSLQENFGLPNLQKFSRGYWLNVRQERRAFQEHARKLGIRARGPKQPAGTLSGGNQQKVVLAKWLERNANVIIFDEPTRGIDVGAKFEIYQLMNELARQGKAILMITSEFPEALGMADRILVMHDGRITGEITDVPAATQQELLRLAVA